MLTPTTTEREERRSAEVELGGSMAEAIAGVAGVVLAILTLVGVFPSYLAAIAAIAIGAGLLFEGAAIAARYNTLLWETGETRRTEDELGGGMTAELFGGIAGVVLGILALLHLVPMVLLPVTAIVFGGALLIGCGATARLNRLVIERAGTMFRGMSRRLAGEAVSAAAGAQVLVGLGAVVLGILGLVPDFPTLTLSAVAFLCVGASILLSGAALSGKFLNLLNRRW
jgi:hypothetical protein